MALRILLPLVPCLALAALPACESKQSETKRETTGDAGPPRPPGVDKNLAEAVAAAAGAAAEQSGPPPTGIFAPGAADKEIKATDPPKFTLGGKGSGPTVTFGGSASKTGKALNARTEVSVRLGPQQGLPTMDLSFSVDPEKPAPEAPAGAPRTATAKVTVAKLAKEQPGTLPPELAEQAAKIKGSKLKLEVAPSGATRIVAVEPSKDSEETLGLVLRAAGDALVLAYLPYPTEPVGAGAYWLVTSREPFSGLDVVAYRMIKFEKLDGEKAVLSVNTKRYVAGGQFGILGLPQHQMLEFAGNSSGQIAVATAEPGNLQGVVTDQVAANIQVPGQPQGRDKLSLQLQMRTQVAVQAK